MPSNLTTTRAPGPKVLSWRDHLRRAVGDPNRLWRVMIELAEGRAYCPVLPDGREGPPVIPTPEIRLRAATELADRLYGRAVSATEQVAAEAAAHDLEAIRALPDGDLEARARAILARGLEPGPEVDGELVLDPRELGERAWVGEPGPEGGVWESEEGAVES